MQLFGESDVKFHVRGGNDQVVAGLAAALGGQIRTGAALTSIARTAAGRYRLGFDGAPDAVFDHVVLALPFSILRDLDYGRAGFDRVKTIAIEEQGMGASAKLHVQFDRRFWNAQGCNGETFADTGYQNTWEVSRAQAGQSGLLVDFTGGSTVAQFANGSATAHASRFLSRLEPVLPGATARWNGRATLDYWPGNPWVKGSYSYWKVGQYTRFAGAEAARSGTCHFAGEHTSIDFQGYLNGAVATGERAASEVLA
jgi:monoamine oxidase